MTIACLDTNILYWAIVQKSVSGVENFVQPAIDFLKRLEDNQISVIIPTIIVGELLISVPEVDYALVLSKFTDNLLIVEYNLKSAVIFARLQRDHRTKNRIKERRLLHPDITKKELNADMMIIATALAYDAEIIYSHDRTLRAMAEGYIIAKDFTEEME